MTLKEQERYDGNSIDEPIYIFPDDEEDGYEAAPIVFDDDEDYGQPDPAFKTDEYDFRSAAGAPDNGISFADAAPPPAKSPAQPPTDEPDASLLDYDSRSYGMEPTAVEPSSLQNAAERSAPDFGDPDRMPITSRIREESASSKPIEYPEGSLGAFSTPEDYAAVSVPASKVEDDYDSPIMIFPEDEVDEYDARSAAQSPKQEKTAPRLSSSTADGNLNDSIGISFSKYSADAKDSEFFFMPFLDVPDEPEDEEEDEEEEVSFSFKKVDIEAVKKEKEFIFMPFLNISDEEEEAPKAEDDHLHHRSSKGTIFDEGLYLIPLESEEEEEETAVAEEEEDDGGISFAAVVGGTVPAAPKNPRPAAPKNTGSSTKKKKSTQKQSSAGKKPQQGKSGTGQKKASTGQKKTSGSQSKGGSNPTAEELFRAAMRSVNPEIRAAVKNDPIQRAALEQAVRIALVQQAAQEAVERSTGRPTFGAGLAAAVQQASKKKKPPKPPQRQSQASSQATIQHKPRAGGLNFSPISLRAVEYDETPAEFGVEEPPKSTQPQALDFGASKLPQQVGSPAQPNPPAQGVIPPIGAADPKPAPAAPPVPPVQPPAMPPQPPVNRLDAGQDPVIEALTGVGGAAQRRSSYQSPAAVRAAMRQGADATVTQAARAAITPSGRSAVDAEEQGKRSGCLIWIIVSFIILFIGIIAIIVMPTLEKRSEYNKAVGYMTAGQYEEALKIFEGTFGTNQGDRTSWDYDSKKLAEECSLEMAQKLYDQGKFKEASELILDKVSDNERSRKLLLASFYAYAETFYAAGDWVNASIQYSSNLVAENYLDSRDKYNNCQYNLGIESANNGDYAAAYTTFYALGDYQDAPYRSALMLYQMWLNDQSFGTPEQYRSAMETLIANLPAEEAQQALRSSCFNRTRMLGEWTDGSTLLAITIDTENSSVINFMLYKQAATGSTTVTFRDVRFRDNVLYEADDEQHTELIELLGFATGQDILGQDEYAALYTLAPNSVRFVSRLDGLEYVLTRRNTQ